MSQVDIVLSAIKCKIFKKLFIQHNFITQRFINNNYRQYFEINSKIYTNYINFKNEYVNNFKLFISKIKQINNSIGIHYRMRDSCFNKMCIIYISGLNNKTAKRIINGYDYIQYMPNQNAIHIAMIDRKITKNETNKIIGDILLISSAKYLILTAGSTFSLLILAIGGIDINQKMKKYSLYDNKGNIVNKSHMDIIETELKRNKCIPCVYYSAI